MSAPPGGGPAKPTLKTLSGLASGDGEIAATGASSCATATVGAPSHCTVHSRQTHRSVGIAADAVTLIGVAVQFCTSAATRNVEVRPSAAAGKGLSLES